MFKLIKDIKMLISNKLPCHIKLLFTKSYIIGMRVGIIVFVVIIYVCLVVGFFHFGFQIPKL
jgi:hypothetical protein